MLPLIWLLLCMTLVLGLAYFFTKYVMGRSFPGSVWGMQQGMMTVVAQMHLGRDRQILLIQVGERYFLVGNTAAQMTTLAELSAEEVSAWCEKEKGDTGQPVSFRQSLQEILKQRSGRCSGD